MRPGPHYGLWSMDPVSHARPSTLSPVSYCSTRLPLRIGGLVGLGTPRAQGCPAMDWVMVQPATSRLRVHLSTSCPRQVGWLVFNGTFSTDRLSCHRRQFPPCPWLLTQAFLRHGRVETLVDPLTRPNFCKVNKSVTDVSAMSPDILVNAGFHFRPLN